MEEILVSIIQECKSLRLKDKELIKNSLTAKGLLESQSNLMKCHPFELRFAFFNLFKMCLETKQIKLTSLAISGYQKLLRDNQFYSAPEEPDESTWLPCQILSSLKSFSNFSEDIQVELLKVLINMSCIQDIALSGHLVVNILAFCGSAYKKNNISMQSASLSASIQAITSLLMQIRNSSLCDEHFKKDLEFQENYPTLDEVVPIINFIAEKLAEANKHRDGKSEIEIPALFLLECADCLIQGLAKFNNYDKRGTIGELKNPFPTMLIMSVWQRLCPSIIAVLGTPISTKVFRGAGRMQGQLGRGSGTFSLPHQLFNSQEAKVIYSVSCNLVVALGSVGEMRPVLESLLHRMLLYPPPNHRQDSLRALLEILKNPLKLLSVAGPILYPDPRNLQRCDLSLFQLIIDSMMECSNCNDVSLKVIIMDCIDALLTSLEAICNGPYLTVQQIQHINTTFINIEDGDYKGPLTYDNQIQLPNYSFFMKSKSTSHDNLSLESDIFSDQELDIDAKGLYGDEECLENNLESCSISSGETEGPDILEKQYITLTQGEMDEDSRLSRLCQNIERESSSRNVEVIYDSDEEKQCKNARRFCDTLNAVLPSLLTIRSTIEIDQAILEFASKYCQGIWNETSTDSCQIIINADGIYLATYAALSLNLQLINCGYYCRTGASIPINNDQFLENVFASGVLVYLTRSWLTELYLQVTLDNFLQRAGYNPNLSDNCALINILTDIDGLGSIEEGSQMLSDYRRLNKPGLLLQKNESVLASQKLCRRILTCCWESVVSILRIFLKYLEGEKEILAPMRLLLMTENIRKDESRRGQDMLILCLNSLQSITRLANMLGLQRRCGVVFSLLSLACLPKEGLWSVQKKKMLHILYLTKTPLKLHRAHVLSFHVMMSCGIELGSHTSECWRHLIKCCLYIAKLERRFYHELNNCSSLGIGRKEKLDEDSSDGLLQYSLTSSSIPELNKNVNIEELIMQFEKEISATGFLSAQLSLKVLCRLTLLVDKFFENGYTQLNLCSLLSFLSALTEASESQLFVPPKKKLAGRNIFRRAIKKYENEMSVATANAIEEDLLLFHRLSEIVLKLVKSGRPLIHIIKVWAIVGPHFLKAACHHDNAVSKEAVSSIHDVINIFLSNHVELPHFHFNESLFKPFENLLCLELCDLEIQEQIVSSICEFVESCNSDIKSGWRPLFGALRCVKAPPKRVSMDSQGTCNVSVDHLRAVRDVFEAFLKTENPLVFANAAVDCILCLLNHLKLQGTEDEGVERVVCFTELVGSDFCTEALGYLKRCAIIFSSLYGMSTVPAFHAIYRNGGLKPNYVDLLLPTVDEEYLNFLMQDTNSHVLQIDYSCIWPKETTHEEILEWKNSDLLHVWYILIEGIAGSLFTCPKKYQFKVLDTLFELMKGLPNSEDERFGLYCANHILLPFMQEWLRRFSDSQSLISDNSSAFKQYVGFTTDLIVYFVQEMKTEDALSTKPSYQLLLQQSLGILTECICSSCEDIARLGCSCIRHFAISCGPILPSKFLNILILSIHRTSKLSLYQLYQLMNFFKPHSSNFYGDSGQVKVAARRDCKQQDSDRLHQLAQQVFQLHLSPTANEVDDRSFLFLLCPEGTEDLEPIRIFFKDIVVGLFVNQMILQLAQFILINNSKHSHHLKLPHLNVSNSQTEDTNPKELPGLLDLLTVKQTEILLDAVWMPYLAAYHFDSRPGLKFLLQKVAQSSEACNLYEQSCTCWSIRMLTLYELVLWKLQKGLKATDLRKVVENETCTSGKLYFEITSCETLIADKKDFSKFILMLLKTLQELTENFQTIMEKTIEIDHIIEDNKPKKVNEEKLRPKLVAEDLSEENSYGILGSSSLPIKMTLGASLPIEDEEPCMDLNPFEEEEKPPDALISDERNVNEVIGNYRNRKNCHAFPVCRVENRLNPFNENFSPPHSVPAEIEQQRKTSFFQDHETYKSNLTELVSSVLELFGDLKDEDLGALSPLLLNSIQTLSSRPKVPLINDKATQLFQRISSLSL